MPDEVLRLHPAMIVENSIRITFSIAIIILLAGRLDLASMAWACAAVLAAVVVFNYWQWKRTTVRIGEGEVVIERNTMFKLKKTLPYSKIAAVNVSRGIVNRVFGTSRLMININSGHNAMAPEASLTFSEAIADRARDTISRRLYFQDAQAEEPAELLVAFTPTDVVLHSLFSVPTYQTLLGAFFLANSVFELFTSMSSDVQAGGSALVSLGMFFLVQIVPSAMQLLRYYNFKVYRRGEVIYLQHGLLRTYRTSFPVSKINAVRVKSTLPSRLLRRSCIEAEVVGIATGDGNGNSRPVICLLKDDSTTRRLFKELVPEFIQDRRPGRQPESAGSVLRVRTVIASAVLVALMAYPSLLVLDEASELSGLSALAPAALPLITALAVLFFVYAARTSYRVREMDLGDELFTFVNGILDRETVVMRYDKVQMVRVTRGPISRRFGVASATVHMLSSIGSKTFTSGLYPEDRLDRIGEIVMERIASGKYDWRNGT